MSPHLCCGCGFIGELLCPSCKYDIINDRPETCILCDTTSLTGVCRHHQTDYKRAWYAGQRKGSLEQLIDQFKFGRVRDADEPLVEILDTIMPVLPNSVVVVPIPTALNHIRERGYDHTRLLAKGFAKKRGLVFHALLQRNHNHSQRGANKQVRLLQAENAFRVTTPLEAKTTYLLLDDVVTTGATVQAAARELHKAGACKIYLVALTRQPLD